MSNLIDKYIDNNNYKHISIGIIINNEMYKFHYNKNGLTNNDYEYFIGSISKTFTAHLTMKYVLNNMLDLNVSCGKYLEIGMDYPTIANLLNHKAGYNHFTPYELVLKNLLLKNYNKENIYDNVDEQKVIELLTKRKKRNNKTYNYSYSDFNYAILACVLTKITGKKIYDLMNDFIKNDLGLNDTYIINKDLDSVYHNKLVKPWHWSDNNPYAYAGGIISNIDDMLKYMNIQLYSKDEMIYKCHEINYGKKDKELIACGWHCKKNSGHLWHVGGVGTHRCSMVISKNKKLAVAVFTNSPGISKANCHYICKKIYSCLTRKKNKINSDNFGEELLNILKD